MNVGGTVITTFLFRLALVLKFSLLLHTLVVQFCVGIYDFQATTSKKSKSAEGNPII